MWVAPQYSRSQVDWAGAILADLKVEDDLDSALQIVNNWRASHSFPLNTFQITLRNKARMVDKKCLIAQRIKRFASIAYKLIRFKTMKLSQMQDIGGCRAVVSNVAHVEELRELYRVSRLKHHLIREDDYVNEPKTSGYRSVHLIYRYRSDRQDTYNGLQIEIQLRSKLQHAWATAVETVGTFLRQSLKASQGDEDWQRFFKLMSSEMALREGTPIVPGTPESEKELLEELRSYAKELDVDKKLWAYTMSLSALDRPHMKKAYYFLLHLTPAEGRLSIISFRRSELEEAMTAYLNIESSLKEKADEAVLVSVRSMSDLRRAYANYFLDTNVFRQAVKKAIS
jgi:hypothetical protein